MTKVGLIGCGAIGKELARAITKRFAGAMKLAAVCDRNPQAIRNLKRTLGLTCPELSPTDLIRRCDLVIEAASQSAVGQILPLAIRLKKKILIMSVGGLLKFSGLLRRTKGAQVYIPSGAIGGLDALLAARSGNIKSVMLTTRKPVSSLLSTSLPKRIQLKLKRIKKPTLLFEGTARSAVHKFPQNVNVAATLSLAGIGAKQTRVRIFASPTYHRNTHEIEVAGDFGRFRTVLENVLSAANPKTSHLAVLSAISCLEKIFCPIKIGT